MLESTIWFQKNVIWSNVLKISIAHRRISNISIIHKRINKTQFNARDVTVLLHKLVYSGQLRSQHTGNHVQAQRDGSGSWTWWRPWSRTFNNNTNQQPVTKLTNTESSFIGICPSVWRRQTTKRVIHISSYVTNACAALVVYFISKQQLLNVIN